MSLKVDRVDTWAASIEDRPGSLAAKLNALTGAGANLEFVITRRAAEHGGGVLFVTPLDGPRQIRVAREVGFEKSQSLHTIRVEGPHRPGHGVNMAEALAAVGLNLRGLAAAAIGKKFVAHLALDTAVDAAKALRVLRKL